VRLDVVPGLAHRGLQLQPVVQDFFAGVLAGRP